MNNIHLISSPPLPLQDCILSLVVIQLCCIMLPTMSNKIIYATEKVPETSLLSWWHFWGGSTIPKPDGAHLLPTPRLYGLRPYLPPWTWPSIRHKPFLVHQISLMWNIETLPRFKRIHSGDPYNGWWRRGGTYGLFYEDGILQLVGWSWYIQGRLLWSIADMVSRSLFEI